MPPSAPMPCARTRLLGLGADQRAWPGACGMTVGSRGNARLTPWLAETKAHNRAFALEQRGPCQAPRPDRVLEQGGGEKQPAVTLRVRYT